VPGFHTQISVSFYAVIVLYFFYVLAPGISAIIIHRVQKEKSNYDKIIRINNINRIVSFYVPAILFQAFSENYTSVLQVISVLTYAMMLTSLYNVVQTCWLELSGPVISLILHYVIWNINGTKNIHLEDVVITILIVSLLYLMASLTRKHRLKLKNFICHNIMNDFTIDFQLTKKEKEIITCIVQGKNTKEISEDHFISSKTVRTHIDNIFRKTETHSRIELIAKFIDF